MLDPTRPCEATSEAQLRLLLDDRLDPESQDALTLHLEECPACRDAFDRMVAESRFWDDARDALGVVEGEDEEGSDPESSATEHYESPSEPVVIDPSRPAGLPFLEPTDTPGHLGKFGAYEVIDVIGRGGMGVVLKAFDPALHRVVAIKVLAPQLAAGPAARRRFLREGRAAASVCHEHVVTIHAVDESEGFPYLVMQYVGGKSLQERIDKSGPLEVKEILRIGLQTAAGLAAAHAQGLVHRDVKPANILLENGIERVKLSDFGLARAIDDPALTQAGVVAGTPEYMAPEQARGEAVDGRADLFSLGGVLYAMATGRSPFRAPTTMAVLRKVCDEPPRPIRDANPDIPHWLAALIGKLLAKHPSDRYGSAAEVSALLADHLARLQQGLEPVAEDVGPQKPAPAEDVGPAKRAPRRPARLAVASVLALGVVGLGVGEVSGVTNLGDLVATILRIKTPEGTLVVEAEDPEVQVQVDGRDLVLSGGGVKELRLKAGPHRLQAIRGGKVGPVELIAIERGGKPTVRVTLEDDGTPRVVTGPADVAAERRPTYVTRSLRDLLESRAEIEGRLATSRAELDAAKAALEASQAEDRRVRERLDWSEQMHAKKFLSAAQLRADQLGLLRAEAEVKKAEADLTAAEAARQAVERERDRLESEIGLIQSQLRPGAGGAALSPGDVIASVAAARAAEARSVVAGARARLARAEAEHGVAEATLKAREIEVEHARKLVEQGVAPRDSLQQAERHRDEARAQMKRAESDRVAAQEALGRSEGEAVKLAAESGAAFPLDALPGLDAAKLDRLIVGRLPGMSPDVLRRVTPRPDLWLKPARPADLDAAKARLEQAQAEYQAATAALREAEQRLEPLALRQGPRQATSSDPEKATREETTSHGVAWGLDLEQARDRAEVSGRPVLIMFTSVNTPNCRRMEAEVLPRPEVVDLLVQFEPVQLCVDVVPIASLKPEDRTELAEANAALQLELVEQSTQPYFVVLDADRNVLAQAGFAEAPAFADFLRDGLEKAPKTDASTRRQEAEAARARAMQAMKETGGDLKNAREDLGHLEQDRAEVDVLREHLKDLERQEDSLRGLSRQEVLRRQIELFQRELEENARRSGDPRAQQRPSNLGNYRVRGFSFPRRVPTPLRPEAEKEAPPTPDGAAPAPSDEACPDLPETPEAVEGDQPEQDESADDGPRLRVDVDGPERVHPEEEASYVLRLANRGNAPASNVVAAVRIPEGGRPLAAIPEGARWVMERRTLYWREDALAPGESREYQVKVRIAPGGAFSVIAGATATDLSKIVDWKTTRIEGETRLVCELTENHGSLKPGETVRFQIRLGNVGTAEARGVRLTAKFSGKLRPVRFGIPGRDGFEVPKGSDDMSPSPESQFEFPPIDRLPVGHDALLFVEAVAEGEGQGTCEVTARHDDLDGEPPVLATTVVQIAARPGGDGAERPSPAGDDLGDELDPLRKPFESDPAISALVRQMDELRQQREKIARVTRRPDGDPAMRAVERRLDEVKAEYEARMKDAQLRLRREPDAGGDGPADAPDDAAPGPDADDVSIRPAPRYQLARSAEDVEGRDDSPTWVPSVYAPAGRPIVVAPGRGLFRVPADGEIGGRPAAFTVRRPAPAGE